MKKYPTPSNFSKAEAPKMNAEILASLSDLSLKRDKRIYNRQNITGKLMTCLGKSLTSLLKGNINSKVLIEEINDAAKLAAEIHHQDSASRKFFALSGANKVVQDAMKNSKTDEFLFGADSTEKIKTAQSIKRTSSQIKINDKKETTKPNFNSKKQVNWIGPLQYQHQQRTRNGPQQQATTPAFKKQLRYDQTQQKGRKHAPQQSRSRHRF
ncbi:unnamed protein product [Parnassius apollo]|uniref:(apollo) hypothetical protein n=1 Tax=Parnassius apollo TaxID=110799 RepID=A0A8S3YCG0_PARAO|nr:unnamed protein product [Parnassius apollo]